MRSRFKAAAAGGYDSADGTALAFHPTKRLAEMRRWLTTVETSPFLDLGWQ